MPSVVDVLAARVSTLESLYAALDARLTRLSLAVVIAAGAGSLLGQLLSAPVAAAMGAP